MCTAPCRPSQLVIVFRGTQTTHEWLEDATLFMEQLEGEEPEHGFALFFNRKVGGTRSRLPVRQGLVHTGAFGDVCEPARAVALGCSDWSWWRGGERLRFMQTFPSHQCFQVGSNTSE